MQQKRDVEIYPFNSENLHLIIYDKMDDNRKIDKIEDYFHKISDTMKGIQIQLEYQ